MPSKVDTKQRDKMVDDIITSHPEYGSDSLKRYYVEQMVESYLADSKEFTRRANDFEKEEKKKAKRGRPSLSNRMPDEIVCIQKVTDSNVPMKFDTKYDVNADGKIVVDLS